MRRVAQCNRVNRFTLTKLAQDQGSVVLGHAVYGIRLRVGRNAQLQCKVNRLFCGYVPSHFVNYVAIDIIAAPTLRETPSLHLYAFIYCTKQEAAEHPKVYGSLLLYDFNGEKRKN